MSDRSYSPRGERVAQVVEQFLTETGLTQSELAWKAGVEKRDLQRLLDRRQCGSRLEDKLAEFIGWEDFTIAIMTPVHGADYASSLERKVEQHLAEAARLHDQVQRLADIRARAAARSSDRRRGRPVRGASDGRSGRRQSVYGPCQPA